MSKIKSIFTQAQDFVADIRSRNKLYHDLIFEVVEQTLNDNKEPPKEATVIKTFPETQTGTDLESGKEQYQAAILRVDKLHDCLPDPARVAKSATVGEVNRLVDAHLLCYSIDPISSAEASQAPQSLVQLGDIVPVEIINGAIRFGAKKGTNPDYLFFYPSQDPEAQDAKAQDEELQNKLQNSKSSLLGDLTPPSIADDPSKRQTAIHIPTEKQIKNGSIPSSMLKTWDKIPKEILGGGPVMFLSDIYDSFVLLAKDFKDHFGYELPVTDSYRSYEEQVETKTRKLKAGEGHKAATPGTSNHGWGIAFDYNTVDADGVSGFDGKHYKWLFKNAPKRGFHSPSWAQKGARNSKGKLTEEAWHFEWIKKKELIKILKEKAKKETE